MSGGGDSNDSPLTMSTPTQMIELQKAVSELESKSRFFELLIRSLPGVFYVFDQNLRFLNCNENMERVTGYSRDEIRNLTVKELFRGEDQRKVIQAIRRAFSRGEATVEANMMSKVGKTVPYFFTGVTTRIDESTSLLLGMGVDLSELRRTQDALRESESFYRALAEKMTVGVFLCQGSKIVFANDSVVATFGYENAEELLGRNIHDLVSKDYEIYFRQVFVSLEKGFSRQRSFEARCLTKTGREIWVEGQATIIRWKGLPTVFMTTRDITKAKQRELLMQEEAEVLRRENVNLRSSIKDRYRLGKIIGKSAAMQEVYELILDAAATNASVIIYGESGTGKELVARAIHEMSARSSRPFVPVNCAAIPENLLESEFFGYKKGAFTGAHADKRGYLDLADGGTLFLDEVTELSLALQAKLLRAIEGGGYRPVGGSVDKFSDFRIIAATNLDLIEQLKKGAMREDFFYRIHVIPIKVPPLRDRREDIPLLFEHFLRTYCDGGDLPEVAGEVLESLVRYDWPGNVRELQNAIQRYIAVKRLEFLPLTSYGLKDGAVKGTAVRGPEDFRLLRNIEDAERAAIGKALEQCHGKKGMAAKALGISRKTLFRKMKRLGMT